MERPLQTTDWMKSPVAPPRELEQIRAALDRSAIVAVTDRTGAITHVNDKFCEISGYSQKELLGANHRIVNSGVHSREFFVEMWKTISSGQVWEGEICNRAKSGHLYWVNTTIVPFPDDQGKPYQYVSIRYDITERKRAEDQLAKMIEQDRLAAVGLLASSLAHEIGTPLGVIRGRAELLSAQSGGNSEVVRNAEIIVSQIDRVSKLIRSLLNLARGNPTEISGVVDLRRVLSEVSELIAHLFRKNGIVWDNRISQDVVVRVRAEGESLHQVFLNLLVNAVHAIEDAISQGRASDHRISVSAQLRSGNWEVSVADTGCGIPKKNINKMFTPFFTTKDIGVGTGLGLATSYRIIEGWGGSIAVESEEGRGTRFLIQLPAVKSD